MDIRELQNLNLSSKDFDLMVDGLKNLQYKDQAGDLMFGLLGHMITKGDDEAMAKLEAERAVEKAKKEREKQLMIEETTILQGKLLMFKRFMQENDLLAEIAAAMKT